MRFVLISVALSVGLAANSVYGMDICRDAFGASNLVSGEDGGGSLHRLAIRSVDPQGLEAEASLRDVNQFLAPSGLLTPKMLNLEIAPTVQTQARFDFFKNAIKMQPNHAALVPLDVHAPFIHEYGHAVFGYSALRDSPSYRVIIKAMAQYQRLWNQYAPIQAEHQRMIDARDFDGALVLRPTLLEAKAELQAFQEKNKRDLELWAFSGVYQEAFADLVAVLYLKDPSALVKFDEDPLRNYVELLSPDHYMNRDSHYALSPFVRHVVQRTLISGEVTPTDALRAVHRLIIRSMAKVQADSVFGVGDPRKMNKIDMLKREAYIQGYRVSDLNRDLISGFDQIFSVSK